MSYGKRYSVSSKAGPPADDDLPAVGTSVPRQKVTARCRSIDRYGESDVDLTRKRSFTDEYFKRVARDLKSIPCLLLLGNIFAFVFLIIWSNIAKHLFSYGSSTTVSVVSETTAPILDTIREKRTCSKPRCGAMGHALWYSLNEAAPPCSDIVGHACTGWLHASEHTYRKVTLGSSLLYLEDMYKDLQRSLISMNVATTSPNALQKASVFYQSCLRDKLSTTDNTDQLRMIFKEYKLTGWPFENTLPGIGIETLLPQYLHKTQDAAILTVTTAKVLSAAPIIDTPNVDKKIQLSLDCPTFIMPRYMYVIPSMTKIRQEYALYVEQSIAGFAKNVSGVPLSIVGFETNQAYIVRKYCHRRRLRLIRVDELNNNVQGIEWSSFLTEIMGNSSYKVNNSTNVLIRSQNYLRYVASLRHAPKNMRAVNYIGWRLLQYFGRHASSKSREQDNAFFDSVLNRSQYSTKQRDHRVWKECLMVANEVMPMAVGRVYVEMNTRVKTFLQVNELVQKVLFSFKYMISQSVWLRPEERREAYVRIGATQTMVSIPPWIANDSLLGEYYDGLKMDPYNAHFFNLFVAATAHAAGKRFIALEIEQDLRSPQNATKDRARALASVSIKRLHSFIFPERIVDLRLHQNSPRQSLLYDALDNVILLPSGILQPPYFDPLVPHAFNYGGLGVLLLHDIVNEFFRFFFNVDSNNWRKRMKCINDNVYRQREDNSGGLDESRDMYTVVFTMMTVRAAYTAYHYFLDIDDDNIVSGLWPGVNPDQLFFLSSVKTMCALVRDKYWPLVQVRGDEALLRKITSAFQGLNELSDAFRCAAGDMSKYYKCMESGSNDDGS